jgi:hypothetical protein
MKRILKMMTLLFVLVLSFSLIGCSSTASSSKEKQEPKKGKTTETVKIKPEKSSNISKESTISVKEKKDTVSKTTPETSKQTEAVVQQKTATSSNSKTTTSSTSKTRTTKSNQVPLKTVTLSITGPKDHKGILSSSKVTIKDGETIFDVLLHATKKAGIQVDYDGGGATAYVNGIDNIYEFDYGPRSGWLFKLNGVSLTKSSGLVKIKAGDRIECYYTE